MQSAIDRARAEFGREAMVIAMRLTEHASGKRTAEGIVESIVMNPTLLGMAGCVFVGHKNTDMDSIGSGPSGHHCQGILHSHHRLVRMPCAGSITPE